MSSLEQDREYLLRSIEDLERERESGDLEERDYLALKDDYTARAAAVLRAIGTAAGSGDETGPPASVAAGSTEVADAGPVTMTPSAPRRRRLRPVLVVATLVAFAAGAGTLVARSAGERLPDDPATGSIASTGPAGAIATDLSQARRLIGEGRTLDAIKVYDSVLARDAGHPEALAYRGWLLRLAGRAAGKPELIDKAMEYIERAVAADPTYPDARFFRAFVLYQDRGNPAGAVPDLRAFLAGDAPREMVPVVEDMLRRALADIEAKPPQGVPTQPGTG